MKNSIKFILSMVILFIAGSIAYNAGASELLSEGIGLAFALPAGFVNLKHGCGSENMGGYQNRLLFIPACSVSSIPELASAVAETEDLVTAVGSFVFNDNGDKPILIYATDKTVQLDAENQGETDGQSFRQFGEFFHPGTKVEVGAFARAVNNTPGYLVVVGPDGTQYMVGSKGLPCSLKPAYAGGAARTDRKGTTFTFEADSFAPYVILGTPIDFDEIENPVTP